MLSHWQLFIDFISKMSTDFPIKYWILTFSAILILYNYALANPSCTTTSVVHVMNCMGLYVKNIFVLLSQAQQIVIFSSYRQSFFSFIYLHDCFLFSNYFPVDILQLSCCGIYNYVKYECASCLTHVFRVLTYLTSSYKVTVIIKEKRLRYWKKYLNT